MISEIYGFTMNPLESTGLERAYIKLIWKTKPKFFLRFPGRDYYITHVPVYNDFVLTNDSCYLPELSEKLGFKDGRDGFLGQREIPRMIGDVTKILAEMAMNQNPTWMVP